MHLGDELALSDQVSLAGVALVIRPYYFSHLYTDAERIHHIPTGYLQARAAEEGLEGGCFWGHLNMTTILVAMATLGKDGGEGGAKAPEAPMVRRPCLQGRGPWDPRLLIPSSRRKLRAGVAP